MFQLKTTQLLSLERYQNTAGTIQKREKRNGAQIADCNHKQFSFITVGASMQKDKTGSIESTTLKEFMKIEQNLNWQTRSRGDNDSEYQIYLACADNGKGIDVTTGKPLKTYDEWCNS